MEIPQLRHDIESLNCIIGDAIFYKTHSLTKWLMKAIF